MEKERNLLEYLVRWVCAKKSGKILGVFSLSLPKIFSTQKMKEKTKKENLNAN